jgi:hypothetical protein
MVNQNLSEAVAVPDHLTPAAARAAGTYATGWIDASRFQRLVALLQVGTLAGSASINMRWQAATASDGTGSADINSTSCITATLGSASNDKIQPLELRLDQNPSTNRFVRAYVSAATSTWLGGVVVIGNTAIHEPASGYNNSAVVTPVVF